jgi:hypothetical protein
VEPDPRFFFSDPKETICALEGRQERRRLKASSESSLPCPHCPEPPCERSDPLISGAKVGGTLRAFKPMSSSRLQVSSRASLLSLQCRASLLSLQSRASLLSFRSRASPHSLRIRASLFSLRILASLLSLRSRASLLSLRRRVSLLSLRSRASLLSLRTGSPPTVRVLSRSSSGTASRFSCSGAAPRFPRRASLLSLH